MLCNHIKEDDKNMNYVCKYCGNVEPKIPHIECPKCGNHVAYRDAHKRIKKPKTINIRISIT